MYVVTYDISEDRVRSRAAALLGSYGDRVQKSVFSCHLDSDQFAYVVSKLSELIDPHTDAVHLFRQCAPCDEALRFIGQARHYEPEPFWII